jgi:type IX secretion system PorP/SprF family membrane protein
MKRIFAFSILLISALIASSQQLPLYSGYVLNSYLISPAYAGTEDCSPIYLTVRSQWSGMNGISPSTQVLSGHTSIDDYGLGGMVFNDRYGNTSIRGAKFTYAKHFGVGTDSYLSLGASVSASSFAIDQTEYNFFDQNDASISRIRESSFTPNADFGVAFHGEAFRVSVSAFQLIESKLTFGGNTSDSNRLVRHYYMNGAYKIELSDQMQLEPSILLRYSGPTTLQADINALLLVNDMFWGGLSWRSTRFVSVLAGANYKNFRFGYAFDLSLGKLSTLGSASHEIVLGYRFPLSSKNSRPAL